MHVPDGPVGIVGQRIDRLDTEHRPFEGGHAIERHRHDHHSDDRIGADFVPCAVERHQSVDHAAPTGHPQDHGENHTQRLRPIGQCGVMQVVRSRPDVEKDQRPEMDDGEPVTVDRSFGLFGHEVIHHGEERHSQEERDRIVSIPPLGQSILDACEGGERKRSVPRDRHRQVVDDMQHRDGNDEREVEPVRDVDVRFGPARQRANEDDQIGHPNDG